MPQPDISESVRRIHYGALSQRQQLRRMIANLINPYREIQRLFYGDDGALKPEAVAWLARLARANFVNGSSFDPDSRVHARNEGRRELAMDILASLHLDTAKLDHLNRQLKDLDSE